MFVLKNNSHSRLSPKPDKKESDSIPAEAQCWLPSVTAVLPQMALILASLELSSFDISFVFVSLKRVIFASVL